MFAFLPWALTVAVTATPAGGAPNTAPQVVALIVANNASHKAGRSPLQYADDDGAKYHEVFTTVASADDVVLLSELDSDTRRIFPHLSHRALSPTHQHLEDAAAGLAAKVAAAKALNREVEFYFVYAGHGDVESGQGYVELEDAAFTAGDLENLLGHVGATRSHVILDSCNSFFVVNPRKAGGKRFATPSNAAASLARRLPNVGVFLSTSAEAEVYEWSELQSGIFSHAVRSGLLGAADADGDGRVSYLELAAFVDLASSEVKNPNFRPKVFARGPAGDDRRAVLDLQDANAVTLKLEPSDQLRLTLRDDLGLRWIDLNKEKGTSLLLRLPRRLAPGMAVEQLRLEGDVERIVARYELGSEGAHQYSSLKAMPRPHQGRGNGADMFRVLFGKPFGPEAVAAYAVAHGEAPEAVYGVSQADTQRMGLLLEQVAALQQSRRHTQLAVTGTAAATLGGLGAMNLTGDPSRRTAGWVYVGSSAVLAIGGVLASVRQAPEEGVRREFFEALNKPGADGARVVARAEARLHEIYADYERWRTFGEVAGWISAGAGVLLTFQGETELRRTGSPTVGSVGGPMLLVLGASTALSSHLSDSPAEKVIELWERESGPTVPRFTLTPVPGGGVLLVTGGF
ncbi:MAG: hypothetical protein ACT4TC_07370 [Myxococcaceae bacterium]